MEQPAQTGLMDVLGLIDFSIYKAFSQDQALIVCEVTRICCEQRNCEEKNRCYWNIRLQW
jgi:hypothetical protein